MELREKGPGPDWIISKLMGAGVPLVEYDVNLAIEGEKKNDNLLAMRGFLKDDRNLLVLGEDNYLMAAKLMRLKFLKDPFLNMHWASQSSLNGMKTLDDITDDIDTLAIIELHPTSSDFLNEKVCGLIGYGVSSGMQMLIGASDGNALELALPYALDTIQNNFSIIEI